MIPSEGKISVVANTVYQRGLVIDSQQREFGAFVEVSISKGIGD